jgi:hypothetical protein
MHALPWLLGGVTLLATVSFSPLGLGLLRYLREHRRDAALTESVLTELGELRSSLSDVIERLDATDRQLRNAPRLPAHRGEPDHAR